MEIRIKDFPEEIVIPIKAMKDETRRKILLAFLDKDYFSYSELKNDFNLKKGTLTHHLHRLVSAGLIRNFTKRIPESRYTSYYEMTDFGCKFINGLRNALQPNIVKTMTFQSVTMSEEQRDMQREESIIGSVAEGEVYAMAGTLNPEIKVRFKR